MSDAHNEHESFIKTPKQLVLAIVASFVVPVVLIVMLVQYVAGENKVGAGSSALTDAATTTRIKPVAVEVLPNDPVVVAANEAAAASAAASAAATPATAPAVSAAASAGQMTADAGKKLYDATCVACHGAGIAGAPKFGDKAAWAERLKQGPEVLYTHSLQGFKGMPPKGGTTAPDEEIKLAVDYMAAAAK